MSTKNVTLVGLGVLLLTVGSVRADSSREANRAEAFNKLSREEPVAKETKAPRRLARRSEQSTARLPMGKFWPGPRVSLVRAAEVETSPAVAEMITEVRGETDFGIFLSGGASKMTSQQQEKLLGLFGAFRILADQGRRFVVGDGGTAEGLMEAAGRARREASKKFPLVGVAAAPNVLLGGKGDEALVPKYQPQIDHTDMIAILPDPAWLPEQKGYGWEPSWGFWGSETPGMYSIFARLVEGKPSVTLLANGGGITLDEVKQNIRQGRDVIAICGSGRVADLVCGEIWGFDTSDNVEAKRAEKVKKALTGADEAATKALRARFHRFDIDQGADGLVAKIQQVLGE